MKSSPSQCVTFERCGRSWYFQKRHKLYAPSNTSQEFGTALHLLAASYLGGTPVPQDWAWALPKHEAAKAERMIEKAKGDVLKHRPGLLIEHSFLLPVGPSQQSGVIDCLDLSGVVEDHKTAASEKWAKTADDLRQDMPMMIYAGYLLTLAKPSKVWLRHNQFILDNETVTFAEVAVTPDEVRQFWRERVVPAMQGQRAVYELPQWKDVPGHEKNSPACTAYKGCPYAAICHGGVPVEKFSFQKPVKDDLPF